MAAASTPRLDCTQRQFVLPPLLLELCHTSEDIIPTFESHCAGNSAELLTDCSKYKVVYFTPYGLIPSKETTKILHILSKFSILKPEFLKNLIF